MAPGDRLTYEEIASLDPKARELIKKLVPEIVDRTMHYAMFMFQHPTHTGIKISVTTPDGETFPDLDAESDGLAGDLIAWIDVYAKERSRTLPEAKVEIPAVRLDEDDDEVVNHDDKS